MFVLYCIFTKIKILQQRIPSCFINFSDTRIVLDCREVLEIIRKQVSDLLKLQMSQYIQVIDWDLYDWGCLASKLWGGSTSDVHITRNCGLLEAL